MPLAVPDPALPLAAREPALPLAAREPALPLAARGLQRGRYHADALVLLRRMIVEGELEFGRRIPEPALCEKLGISRTPFREAVRILSSEGLVTLVPRRGAVVATPSLDEFRGLFIAIGALEGACAPLACDHLTIADVEAIKQAHRAMVEAGARRRRRAYSTANEAIHAAIVAGARNAFLADLHASLTLRVSRARYFVDTPPEAWRRAMDEHIAILAAVEARDGPRLAALLVAHMEQSCADFERLFAGLRIRPLTGAND